MPIEMPFMSTISGIFTQFIYVHITIYRNLTPNITKIQKRVKKDPKKVKNVKIKIALEMQFMRAIFGMFTQFIYAHMTLYRKLTQNITKGQKRAQNR